MIGLESWVPPEVEHHHLRPIVHGVTLRTKDPPEIQERLKPSTNLYDAHSLRQSLHSNWDFASYFRYSFLD
jgi:hypothetical protein